MLYWMGGGDLGGVGRGEYNQSMSFKIIKE